jgi:ribosomal protein L37E
MAEKSLQGIESEEAPIRCPSCGSKDFDLDGVERFCKKCGYVFE